MNDNKFKCGKCGGVFDKGWSDEEALEEKEALFGDISLDKCVIVCGVCFQSINRDILRHYKW